MSLPRFLIVLAAVGFLSTLATSVSDDGSPPPVARAEADEPPAGLTRDDWSQIRRSIQESGYHASRVAKPGEAPALVAPNRQQRYRTEFRRDGIEIVSKPVTGKDWRLGVRVVGYGEAGDLRPLPAAEPQADKQRVEYRRGPVTEWYENRSGGLEQGFTIAEPEMRGSQPIMLAMAVEGGLHVRLEDAGAASFQDSAGRPRVRYVGLAAWDADGRALASWLEASEGELRVLVEAGDARFPVTVDPTFVQEAKLEGHSDPIGVPGAFAGYSVSVSGDTAVVGAPSEDTAAGVDAGSARVFLRSGTVWTEQQKLLASDGAASDNFGRSVSVSGDTAVVGASFDDTAGGANAGSAYVFVRSGTVWSEQQKLLASDGAASDSFGISVSVSGDTAVVGAYFDDTVGGSDAGSAYVFVRSGTLWSQQQKLLASDAAMDDNFGISVSVSGDTAVVGAWLDATAGGLDAGSVYVFRAVPSADLSLTKTDGQGSAVPGTPVTYTIVAANAGPDPVSGASVTDTVPAALTGATWTCVASPGASCTASGNGSIADLVTLPAGGTVTYTLTATIDASATGSLANTATVALPPGGIDPNPADNSATDTDTLTPQGDLTITKTDGQTTAVPGQTVTYTIVASNTGPSNAPGATVTDTFPAALTGVTWTCVAAGGASCSAGGSGNINDTVGLPVGGTATYTATGTVAAGATGTLTNTASVAPPGGVIDPNPTNDSATDIDTLTPQADLGVTKTDGQATAVPGQPVTYTISVTNAGPSDAIGATVTDTVPAVLHGVTWTCTASPGSTCAPSGVGNINDTVNLLVGGTATYTLMATIDPAATGTLDNTATVAAPAGTTDPTPGNNSATDSDTLTPEADLSVTKTDGQTTAVPGQPVTYTITAATTGPSDVTGATVTDTVPAALLGASWTCTASPGSTCAPSGVGNINDTVNLLAGGTATYTLTGTVDPAATGTLVNTVAVAAPSGVTDPNSSNDSATDTDSLLPAGLSVEGELAHGSQGQHDLAALPGPAPDEDVFLILQRAHASHEVLLDGASGDLGSGSGPLLERLDSDAATVLQGSSPAGAGGSRSLRWMNAFDAAVADEFVRVRSAGCTTDCDAADVYRLGARETTGFIPRFNNSGTQVTVLVLQNLGSEAMDLDVRFWSGTGAPLGGPSIQTLGPRASYVLNTSTVAPGSSGSITVANTGRYGQLTGKAVAVEPATGFTFDTAMAPRPR